VTLYIKKVKFQILLIKLSFLFNLTRKRSLSGVKTIRWMKISSFWELGWNTFPAPPSILFGIIFIIRKRFNLGKNIYLLRCFDSKVFALKI